ncbi:MAG: asparaginase [Rubrivivax sp.]|nr:MAG: asparaginase [Rubrivivax sp.]
MNSEKKSGVVVVLGTGGTIAGVSDSGDDRAYRAAQLGVDQLVAAVPALAAWPLEAHQVAQIDSKDMAWPVWRALLQALQIHLARMDVAGIVVTHGTDTLEETALLLHLLLPPLKPVVLTAAMRPATSPQADGPANLLNAVRAASALAAKPLATGGMAGLVSVMMAGHLWAASDLRKVHSRHIDAFDGGEAQALARVAEDGALAWSEQGHWRPSQGWLSEALLALPALPRVEIVTSHADADGMLVDALLTHSRPAGLVVACTGNGTVHERLHEALERAHAQGVAVWRSTRAARGGVACGPQDFWPSAGTLTPAQARLALSLALARQPDLARQPWERWPAARG